MLGVSIAAAGVHAAAAPNITAVLPPAKTAPALLQLAAAQPAPIPNPRPRRSHKATAAAADIVHYDPRALLDQPVAVVRPALLPTGR
jgi:hypothetical protein